MGYIVDLSEYNTVTDWAAAAEDLDAAVLRLGYRGSIRGRDAYKKIMEDRKFRSHLEGCRKNRIPYGVYFFPTGITEAEAIEEAVWIREQVQGLDTCMPVFLDSEYVLADRSGRADRLDKEDRTSLLRVITDHLMADGIRCGIYGCPDWFENNVDLSQLDPAVVQSTWVAQTSKLTYKGSVFLWQYGRRQFRWTSAPVDVDRIMRRRSRLGTFCMRILGRFH